MQQFFDLLLIDEFLMKRNNQTSSIKKLSKSKIIIAHFIIGLKLNFLNNFDRFTVLWFILY